jgi:hypothetical protein
MPVRVDHAPHRDDFELRARAVSSMLEGRSGIRRGSSYRDERPTRSVRVLNGSADRIDAKSRRLSTVEGDATRSAAALRDLIHANRRA